MAQALDDLAVGESLQMGAWLAKPYAVNLDPADLEIFSHQVIQGDTARHHVAARFRGNNLDLVLAVHGLERFGFYQGQLEIGPWLEESTSLKEVAVAFQPRARDSSNLSNRLHGRFRLVRDENEFDLTVPHNSHEWLVILNSAGTSAAKFPRAVEGSLRPALR
jgi:hypothetical protein